MTNRVFGIICTGLICLGSAIAIVFKIITPISAITPDSIANLSVRFGTSTASLADDEDYKSFKEYAIPYSSVEELANNADLIVEVQAIGQWRMEEGYIKSTVNINKVYKGDEDILGKDIYVYEKFSVFKFPSHPAYDNCLTKYYNLMQTGNRYILFLSSRKFPENYKYSEEESKTYLIVNDYLGKYSLNPDEQLKLLSVNKETDIVLYKDIANYEILTCSQALLDQYSQWKKNVLDKYLCIAQSPPVGISRFLVHSK